MKVKGVQVLKLAYLVGAVTDLVMVFVMTIPQIATGFWGFENFTEQYYFAMGLGAPLMFGWTLLIIWAYKKPVERRIISPLTIVVIIGIAITNIIMVNQGLFTVIQMIPSFVNQGILLMLFGFGYLYTKPEKMNINKMVV